jgi:hypothetical protein
MTSLYQISRGKILIALSILSLGGTGLLLIAQRAPVAADVPPP